MENEFPHIKYALDEVALYWIPYGENKYYQTLVIPGAYSVDKYYRLQNGWSWFEGEQLTAAEMEKGLDLIHNFDNIFYCLIITIYFSVLLKFQVV